MKQGKFDKAVDINTSIKITSRGNPLAKQASKSPPNSEDGKELKVKQIVISAILEALNDIVGPDGKDSIIKFAGLEKKYLGMYLRPSLRNWIPRSDLARLSRAMYRLMAWGSNAMLRETGRRFAIYLAPYGYSLKTVAKKLENWIQGDLEIKIEKEDEDTLSITIIGDPFQADMPGGYMWMGFFEVAAANSSHDGSQYVATDYHEEKEENALTRFKLARVTNKNNKGKK
ncbi:hypothetical protein GF325_15895 [Candidatus Bathyarchaeota archaeon]|nr:hypothetical protein [Candidatus Bathyarchaeota archaeon]